MNPEIRELEHLLETLVRIISKETQTLDLYRHACVAPSTDLGRLLCQQLGDDAEAHLTKLHAARDVVQKRLDELRHGKGDTAEG